MPGPTRTYPLRKPDGHQPPVPRWQLVFGDGVTQVHTAYFGVQRHSEGGDPVLPALAVEAVRNRLRGNTGNEPEACEEFDLIEGNDAKGSHVWVCYWTDGQKYKAMLDALALNTLHADLPTSIRASVGFWCETFSIPISRLETNYSGLDYLPGYARLPNTTTEEHTLTAYWGAARDRIPDSAHELFPEDGKAPSVTTPPTGRGRHFIGSNADNIVHIRSGQFWENCSEQEAEAYEKKLEPTLEAGLQFLWKNPEAGAMGLRYLRNTTPDSGRELKETCVTGFFTSLDKLEGWAKSHKSHLAIYNGAMRHAKVFGAERRFRTWHEVVVLKTGEAKFEYVNCDPGTGLLKFVPLDEIPR